MNLFRHILCIQSNLHLCRSPNYDNSTVVKVECEQKAIMFSLSLKWKKNKMEYLYLQWRILKMVEITCDKWNSFYRSKLAASSMQAKRNMLMPISATMPDICKLNHNGWPAQKQLLDASLLFCLHPVMLSRPWKDWRSLLTNTLSLPELWQAPLSLFLYKSLSLRLFLSLQSPVLARILLRQGRNPHPWYIFF